MDIDNWPPVSTEVVEALKKLFPLNPEILTFTPEMTQEWKGIYRVINYLELVNSYQLNPNSEN